MADNTYSISRTSILGGPVGNDPRISVIMAVYNSERFLPGAVESVLAQRFDSFELILVDDGSPDGSGAICDAFAERDPRVRVIHKENGGMCQARNVAMREARGDYLTFMDNDDTILPGFLADNYLLAERYDADCVRFGRWRETLDDDGRIIHRSAAVPRELHVIEREDLAAHYDELRYDTEGVWSGLYRRQMVLENGIEFDESLRHGSEDRLFNSAVYRHANRVVLNPVSYYVWQRRPSHSSSLAFVRNNLEGKQLALEDEAALMHELGVNESNPAFYAKRVTMDLVATMRDGAYSQRSRGDARSTEMYDFLRSIYEPHFEELRDMPLDLTRRTLLTALERRAYAVLDTYAMGGRGLIFLRSLRSKLPR